MGMEQRNYWSAENSSGEIYFLVQDGGNVFDIEMNAEENLRAKSLRVFKDAHPRSESGAFQPFRLPRAGLDAQRATLRHLVQGALEMEHGLRNQEHKAG